MGPVVDIQLSTKQRTAFIDLRRRLKAELWAQPTICPGWNVKDIAAHMLSDRIGRLSTHPTATRHCTLATMRPSPPSSTASTTVG